MLCTVNNVFIYVLTTGGRILGLLLPPSPGIYASKSYGLSSVQRGHSPLVGGKGPSPSAFCL